MRNSALLRSVASKACLNEKIHDRIFCSWIEENGRVVFVKNGVPSLTAMDLQPSKDKREDLQIKTKF